MPKNQKIPGKSHKLRTFFSAILGTLGIYLVLSSVTVVWLNQTLTNTPTYVSTVAPLITKPAIQNFVSQQVTDQLLKSSQQSLQSMATALLPASELTNNPTSSQLSSLLTPVINSNILKIIQSPSFAQLWSSTNKSAHAQLISQLNNNSGEITLNLSPAINGIIGELKTTQLSPIANNVNISPNAGDLKIKSNSISRFHQYYKLFQDATVAIVVLALLLVGASVWLSVHHVKTIRRILFAVGFLSLFQALVLEAPSVIKLPGSNQVTQSAAMAFVSALFHNLQLANLILGVVCLVVAMASKIYSSHKSKIILKQKSA